jgi:outer membrane protein assembly factor BamB
MVVLSGFTDGPVLLSASGERVETGPDVHSWGDTPQGWLITERSGPDGQLQRVYRPGAPPLEVLGRLLERRVDDGSVPGLEVSTGPRTYGWDARTGDQLWEADVVATPGWDDSVLVLDGTVYLSATGKVVALDARTGETRWTAPRLEGAYWGDLLTDGPHLLLVEVPQDAVGAGYVTVLDRRTGAFVRRMEVPDGFSAVVAVGRSLLGTDGERVAGLG